MPVETLPAARQPQWIETTCVAVALPPDTAIDGKTRFIPIAWQARGTLAECTPVIVGAEQAGLPFFLQWRVIELLCAGRAVRTVDGELHVWCGPTTPEDYLGRWRKALKKPVATAELAERYGVGVFVSLGAELRHARTARSAWPDAPFKSFEDLEAL